VKLSERGVWDQWKPCRRKRRLSQKSATVALFCDSRRFRWQIVAEIRDYSRQCGHGYSLSTLSPKTATVAENCDCRRKRRVLQFSATVALFCNSRRFRRQFVAEIGDYSRQCRQALRSMNIDDRRPTSGPILTLWKISNGYNSATRHPIHLTFGSRVGFSGTADRTALVPVGSNPRWRLAVILKKTPNGHISQQRVIWFTLCMYTDLIPSGTIMTDDANDRRLDTFFAREGN